jgi:hypothetical protein
MTSEEITNFRLHFPEFADETTFPDPMIEFWSGIGASRLNVKRWGDLLTHGIELLTAHFMTLAAMNLKAADSGNFGGTTGGGLVSNKSVGDVSVGYDTQSIALKDGGNYNMTYYGREFLYLARIIGIGGLHLI